MESQQEGYGKTINQLSSPVSVHYPSKKDWGRVVCQLIIVGAATMTVGLLGIVACMTENNRRLVRMNEKMDILEQRISDVSKTVHWYVLREPENRADIINIVQKELQINREQCLKRSSQCNNDNS